MVAQVVELLSLQLANRTLEEPVTVPRPDWVTRKAVGSTDNPYADAISKMLGTAHVAPDAR